MSENKIETVDITGGPEMHPNFLDGLLKALEKNQSR